MKPLRNAITTNLIIVNTIFVQVPVQPTEPEPESTSAPKRTAEDSPDGPSEAKKVCSKSEPAPVLEDDLSEISDDADDILNRDEVNIVADCFITEKKNGYFCYNYLIAFNLNRSWWY